MLDNENLEVEQPTELQQALETPQESSTTNENPQPQSNTQQQQKQSPHATSGQPENFRILRERLEAERRQREAMEQRLAEIEARNKPAPVEEDYDFNIGADEIAEGKHLTKVGRKIKQLEEKIALADKKRAELEQQASINATVFSIKADYPDIDKVVNESTMEALRRQDPDLANLLDSSTDLRSKAITAYRAIKDKGLYVEDSYASDRERVQRNVAKPKPTAAISGTGTPLSQADMFANGLTPELKDKLHKEMIEAMKAR